MKKSTLFDHVILILGVLFLLTPLWIALCSSTHTPEYIANNGVQFWFGDQFIETYSGLLDGTSSLFQSTSVNEVKNTSTVIPSENSIYLGFGLIVLKIFILLALAYAIVCFSLPAGEICFALASIVVLYPTQIVFSSEGDIIPRIPPATFSGAILLVTISVIMMYAFRQFHSSTESKRFIHVVSKSKELIIILFMLVLVAGILQYSGTKENGLLMLKNSMILGLGFAIGKIILSMLAAYAIVYFRFPLGGFFFWVIFSSLLLPLEVRIIPSYEIVAKLELVNTYTGLILPLIASATATFYFRQFYLSIPEELIEAARLDNAGPFRFFLDILVPLSKTMIAAIFIIMFVVGWNQYLWPILMTTDSGFKTLLLGIKDIVNVMREGRIPAYNRVFALAVLSVIPPVLIVILFQKWFIKGLVESEK